MKPMTDDKADSAAAGSAEALKAILGAPAGRGKRGHALRRWALILLVVLLAAAGIWYFSGKGESGTLYTTEKATTGDLTVTVTATGSIQPIEQVDVSSELSGRVKTVLVDYNSQVKAGDTLAELVTDTLQVNVQSARAKLAAANANVAKAHATIASTQNIVNSKTVLVGRNVSSSQELIDAQANYDAAVAAEDAAKAEVLAAEADLSLAETNLSKAKIVSPIDGVVLTRSVDPGATVAASLSAPVLFVIAGDLRQMELRVDIDEADVGEVRVGQKASFTVDAFPERSFPASIRDVRFVSETVDNVVTYKGLLTVDNSELLLRPGMTATADIVVDEVDQATLIPNAALRYLPPVAGSSGGGFLFFRAPRMSAITTAEPTGHQRKVWVLRDNVPTAVNIETGASDGSHTVVKSGDIKPGDALIVDSSKAS
jgi:HlyD family secretion protein